MNDKIRLNKYIGASGFCSRRRADEWIAAGKVTVNGCVADMGMRVNASDDIRVDGKPISVIDTTKLVAFYKPRGYACTAHRKDETSIYKHFDLDMSLKYIGRLDKDSEGLLLLSNNGDLCNAISKARNKHEKEYIVTVNRPITDAFIDGMSKGVRIFEPTKEQYVTTRPCVVKRLDTYTFSIVLTQGMNRQIRRMCDSFQYRVKKLCRIRVMNIVLGDMKVGEIKEISETELLALKRQLKD